MEGLSRCIANAMYLEKPKQHIIWKRQYKTRKQIESTTFQERHPTQHDQGLSRIQEQQKKIRRMLVFEQNHMIKENKQSKVHMQQIHLYTLIADSIEARTCRQS